MKIYEIDNCCHPAQKLITQQTRITSAATGRLKAWSHCGYGGKRTSVAGDKNHNKGVSIVMGVPEKMMVYNKKSHLNIK